MSFTNSGSSSSGGRLTLVNRGRTVTDAPHTLPHPKPCARQQDVCESPAIGVAIARARGLGSSVPSIWVVLVPVLAN